MARTENRHIVRATGEIIESAPPPAGAIVPYDPADRIEILDPMAHDGVATDRRLPLALATISAGYRERDADGKPGLPQVSRDGKIYLHDPRKRAPGIKAALEAKQYQSLTIAFPHDDWRYFVQQRFVLYSASKLQIYGDAESVTVIEGPQKRATFAKYSHPQEYRRAIRQCKVQISIYFHLAEWGENGPSVVYPRGDGRGMYRIRTTSRNTIRILDAAITEIAEKTHGHIAGIPFDAIIDYLNTSGPDGSQRTVPVWTFTCRPPFEMRAQLWAEHMTKAIAEAQYLQLPAPRESYESQLVDDAEDVIVADDDDPVVDVPTEDELRRITSGKERFPASVYEAAWFAAVRGSSLDSDEARARFIMDYSDDIGIGSTDSLRAFLAEATPEQAAGLIAAAHRVVNHEQRRARSERTRAGGSHSLGALIDAPYGSDAEFPEGANQRALRSEPASDGDFREMLEPSDMDAEPVDASADVLLEAELIEPVGDPALFAADPADVPTDTERTLYRRLMEDAGRRGWDLADFELDFDDASGALVRGKTARLHQLITAANQRTQTNSGSTQQR